MDTLRIVAIQFRTAGKTYDFDARDFELPAGTQVVVETDRGRALGTVVTPPRVVSKAELPEELKSVLRPASDKDLESAGRHLTREVEALRYCQQRILDRRLDMKLVRAEYLFDGSKIIFYFTADGRVDFRELVKDLAQNFHTRIEMRQIGVRDEAKLIGGIGVCGRELCCCTFLRDFAPVSVKMAKEQGLALNPTKISGQCGRLLCCLGYEFETYCDLRKGLPKCGKRTQLDDQQVEVVQLNLIGQKVVVRYPDGHTATVPAEAVRQGSTVVTPPEGSEHDQPVAPAAPPPPGNRVSGPQRPPAKAQREAPRAEEPPEPAAADTPESDSPKRRRRRRRRGRKPKEA